MSFKDCFINNDKHLADKWESYLDVYSRIFVPYKNKKVRILEIGVMNGGTLDVLAAYFHNAVKIVGVDIDPKCGDLVFEDPRIQVVVADGSTVDLYDCFDIIIDDGSHLSSDIIKTFAVQFPTLKDGGLYVIEDLHASYWQGWGGGLYTPASAIHFLKILADYVNAEHWRIKSNPLDGVEGLYNVKFKDLNISSVEFTNSMCVIRKGASNLGSRLVSGEEELVTETGIWKEHNTGTTIRNIPGTAKEDKQYDTFVLLDMVKYLKERNCGSNGN